jgi:hypothetical protein
LYFFNPNQPSAGGCEKRAAGSPSWLRASEGFGRWRTLLKTEPAVETPR